MPPPTIICGVLALVALGAAVATYTETDWCYGQRLGRARLFGWLMALLAVLLGAAAFAAAPPAAANGPGQAGCETINWGFLGSQLRTICDGPILADGSWLRAREVWIPAHQVPFTCYYGNYYSSCSGGYLVDAHDVSRDVYPVTADTPLPDEPSHLDGPRSQMMLTAE